MSIGFRKSLFGFNQNDVIEYVKKLHDSFDSKEADFKEEITELTKTASRLENEKVELNSRLAEFEAKKAEMERLSENIGKLYLVAQANAKTIMSNAEENSKITDEQISRNVSAIEETHQALDALRKSIDETSRSFNSEVAALMQSLQNAKEKISADTKANSNASQEFATLLEAVSK